MDTETKKMLEEILAAVRGLDSRIAKLEADTPSTVSDVSSGHVPAAKRLALKEFIISQAPSNGVQMTLTIGYYLETFDAVSPFNASDLERAFRAAREPVPPNINDKANMCVRNGHFMEEREKKDNMKAWVLTRTGQEVARKGFGKTPS
jgi:hypothetical protein